MNKTLRLGNYEYILDSRLLYAPQAHSMPVQSPDMQERLRKVERLREIGAPYVSHAAPDEWPTPETERRKEEERRLAEEKRREANRTENGVINGRHLFGWVFYRPPVYKGLKSWVFRTTSKEYSFSIIDMRKRTARQNDLSIKGREAAMNAWMKNSVGPVTPPKDVA
jgi:hypothetical protein